MSHELKYQKYTYLILSINYNQAQAQIKIIVKCINLNADTQFNKKEKNNQKPRHFVILLNTMPSFSKTIFLGKFLALFSCEGIVKS